MDEAVRIFFSYAHSDFETAPALFKPLTKSLEKMVNNRLTNAQIKIWRDFDDLKTGDRWTEQIEHNLRRSDILILTLSPAWVNSGFCREEYRTFEGCEPPIGECVVPVLVRTLETQRHNFTDEQKAVVDSIERRQYFKATAREFLTLRSRERMLALEKLVDDIEVMVNRVRELGRSPADRAAPISVRTRKAEFKAAHNYRDVDFVSFAEVALAPPGPGSTKDVFAQVSFAERLFLECAEGRVEFGVKRAYLSMWCTAEPSVTPSEELQASNQVVTWRERPGALTICLEPEMGRRSLAELSLGVSEEENLYCRVGKVESTLPSELLGASLSFSISSEGLTFFEPEKRISGTLAARIGAVMAVVLAKETVNRKTDLVTRDVPVRSRLS